MTTKPLRRDRAACLGAPTVSVRTTEYMERCRLCGTEVQWQLVNHSFFGFKSGCRRYEEFIRQSKATVS